MGKRKFGPEDIRYAPSYTIAEAARYVRLPPATLRSWVSGRGYLTKSGKSRFQPLFAVGKGLSPLSFINLVEAHVLAAIRRTHQVPMHKIRSAIHWLEREFDSKHPLAEVRIKTDGLDLFVERLGNILSASEHGQIVIRSVLERFLKRVEHDSSGMPSLFYPFTRESDIECPTTIVINPSVGFGRPVIKGTRIGTNIISERYMAGESVQGLANDYNVQIPQIEEAIRCDRAA